MKRLSLLLLAIMYLAFNIQLSATTGYKEDIDSLLHKVRGHRQGVVIVDDEGVKMKVYMSSATKAPNEKTYYRWWKGDFLHAFHDPDRLANEPGAAPLAYGYRFDDEKMYLYNFLTEEESVAYDFTLQLGEQFTTPDGIRWKVVDRRTEVFESMFEYQTEYRNEHVVLSLQSLDGTKTDEWVQYIGSLHYPVQTWGMTDVKLTRTAFFNFGDEDDKLVYFDFAEDPLYGQIIYVAPDPYAMTDINRDYTITAGGESLNIAINYYLWFTRDYCYTYRDGNTFDIHSIELGPYRDGGGAEASSFGLTFPGAPSFDNYHIVYNGETLPASVEMPCGTDVPHSAYDLSGRHLSVSSASSVPSVLPKGVYIKDGQKVMVK